MIQDSLKLYPEGHLFNSFRCASGTADQAAVEGCKHSKEILEGRIIAINVENQIVELAISNTQRGIIPYTEFSVNNAANSIEKLYKGNYVGKHVQFIVTGIEANTIICSRKSAQLALFTQIKKELEEQGYMECRAVVRQITKFGVFAELGAGLTGLIPFSTKHQERIEGCRKIIRVGDPMDVVLSDIKLGDDGRIRITMTEKVVPGLVYCGVVVAKNHEYAMVQIGADVIARVSKVKSDVSEIVDVFIISAGARGMQIIGVDDRYIANKKSYSIAKHSEVKALTPIVLQALLLLLLNAQAVGTWGTIIAYVDCVFGVKLSEQDLLICMETLIGYGLVDQKQIHGISAYVETKFKNHDVMLCKENFQLETEDMVYALTVTAQRLLRKLIFNLQEREEDIQLYEVSGKLNTEEYYAQMLLAVKESKHEHLFKVASFNYFPHIRQLEERFAFTVVLINYLCFFGEFAPDTIGITYAKESLRVRSKVLKNGKRYRIAYIGTHEDIESLKNMIRIESAAALIICVEDALLDTLTKQENLPGESMIIALGQVPRNEL